jgi:serine protease AprX
VVSGAAALLLQNASTLTADQVKARLMKTASKAFPASSIATDPLTGAIYTSQYDIFTIGAGYLDIAAALASTDIATGSAKSPTAVYDSTTGLVRIETDPKMVWNGSLIWDTGVVWGASVFVNGNSVLWGSSVVWGTSTMQGFSLIWGTSLVWGTSTQNTVESINVAILGEN